ncbi:MAG: hypothetical protein NTY19_17510 [Planctomycetota bacterium]|nr:hypothetical protein [Planctomycetota bacterium]
MATTIDSPESSAGRARRSRLAAGLLTSAVYSRELKLWLGWLLWVAGLNVVGAILASVLTPPTVPMVLFQAAGQTVSLGSDGLPTVKIGLAIRRPAGTKEAPIASHDVTVELAVEKPAEAGVHCQLPAADDQTRWTVTIPADRLEVETELTLLSAALDAGLGEIVVTLVATESYSLGKPQQHSIRLPPPKLPVLQFAEERTPLERPAAGESEAQIKVGLVAEPRLGKPFTADISVGGDAQAGQEYTLPGGSADRRLVLPCSPDQVLEIPLTIRPGKIGKTTTIVLTLRKKDGYGVGPRGVQTIVLTDKTGTPRPVIVEFAAATQSPSERPTAPDQKKVVTVKLRATPAPTESLRVPIDLTGSAKPGQDYTVGGRTESRTEVRLSANNPEASLDLNILPEKAKDAVSEKTIVATLQSGSGYKLGSTTVHKLTLNPSVSLPVVKLEAGATELEQGKPAVFTVQVAPALDKQIELQARLVAPGKESDPGTPLSGIGLILPPRSPSGKLTIKLPADPTPGTKQVIIEFTGPDTVVIEPRRFTLTIKDRPVKLEGDVLVLVVATEFVRNQAPQADVRGVLEGLYASDQGPRLMGHKADGNHGVYVLDTSLANAIPLQGGANDPRRIPRLWTLSERLPVPADKYWPAQHSLTDLRNAAYESVRAVTGMANNKEFKTLLIWPSDKTPASLLSSEKDGQIKSQRDLDLTPDREPMYFWLDPLDRENWADVKDFFSEWATLREPSMAIEKLRRMASL